MAEMHWGLARRGLQGPAGASQGPPAAVARGAQVVWGDLGVDLHLPGLPGPLGPLGPLGPPVRFRAARTGVAQGPLQAAEPTPA